MRLVIFAIVAISLTTFVVEAQGELRILQKQNLLSKGFISSFFGSNPQSQKADNNQGNFEEQDLENNLDQLAKALPYQMLLPRRRNSFSSPLGLLGNLIKAKNQQQQSITEQQNNPLEELNQLLESRKKKSDKKAFHWENPDFKEGKKDIPINKIFGSKSKRNHRLQISEEQVQNILENQIPAFREGRLLKLSETSYSKGFFLNVEFLTIKSQVYKVKAKYNQQDNQLQIISMSELINFEHPEEQEQQFIDGEGEEEQDKFIIEEILPDQGNGDNVQVKEQNPSNKKQPIIQKPVQKPIQKKQIKIKQEANPEQKKIQPKIAQKSKVEEKNPAPKIQEIKKELVKESVKQQPFIQQKKIVAQQKIEKIIQNSNVQTKLPAPVKEETKKEVVKQLKKQNQPVKQQKKDQKPFKEAEKIPSSLSKQQQNKVEKPSMKKVEKQVKNASKPQPKPQIKPTSDKQAQSSIVQN